MREHGSMCSREELELRTAHKHIFAADCDDFLNSFNSGLALTHSVVNRVIQEISATISTNGIQELSSQEQGGVSTRGYICACLKATAYNAVRSMPYFDMSYGDFCRAVDTSVDAFLAVEHVNIGLSPEEVEANCNLITAAPILR